MANNQIPLVMSKQMGSIMIGCGILIVVLSFLLKQVSPPLAKVAFASGLAGGALTVLWGIVGLAGHKRRTWAMLTLVVLAFVLLTQVINAWAVPAGDTPGKLVGALLLTFLMVLIVALMTYLMHGERPPEFYRKEPDRPVDSPSGSVPPERGKRLR